mmetsp:Transcript_12587/g.27436  ORF Transcript_12587/g.27436 Transcript_12587/m.27436 type:complete len:513 (-) Transcript_12587:1195-2733(-)|eukprot:CAMPEP_0185844484 /NCGR_PEP_ID=MMETSP1354-20130828/633_1 /TAXON_ID=708628 /ORGANISM="Erythrolobus madagascarensis, Strain CCMP3276" /LENGTH=512 /DNA_ID=CAMNT_0028544157 /DNA_START=27 /DNA_END=1565 /DNA_ORIENTATION=-
MTECGTATNTNGEEVCSELERFYERRRMSSVTIALLMFQQAFILGSSVVAGALLNEFVPVDYRDRVVTYQFHGLYAVSLSLLVSYTVGAEVVLPIFKKYDHHRRTITVLLVALFPSAFVVGGVSVTVHSVPLLYIAFTLLLGITLSVYDVVTRLEILEWWSPDGSKRKGVALAGAAAGAGSIFYTLVSAWALVYIGLAQSLYILAGIQAVLSLYIVCSILAGQLDSPPTAAKIQQWLLDSKEAAGAHAESCSDGAHDVRVVMGENIDSNAPRKEEEQAKEVPPAGTSALVPKQLGSRWETLRYPGVWLVLVSAMCSSFNGYATKLLLSSMFELVFNLSTMTSAYLSACSLTLFFVARAAVPYFLMDRFCSATSIGGIAAAASSIAYAVLPVLVGPNAYETAGFTWQLFGFVAVKSVVGGCFAAQSTVRGSILDDVVGTSNLPYVFQTGWEIGGFFGAAGPIVAFTVSMSRYYAGDTFPQAFSVFFYLAAGVAILNTLVYVLIYRQLYTTTKL